MKNDWESCLLGDLIEINRNNIGKNHPFENICYVDISSVGSGTISFENVIELSDAPSRAKRLAMNGDTIISTVRPGNRSFAYLKKCPLNSVYSTGFAVLHPIQDRINSRFLYYTVSDYSFTGYLTSVEKGASYPSVDTNDIKSARISIPNIKTQNKVASILSAYDDLIENNLKRIKLLEEKAQLTYEEWFVRMKYPGHENDKVDSETGLPEGWCLKKLKDECEITMGQSPKSEYYNHEAKGLPFHQGVKDYGFRFPKNTTWSTSGNRTANEGSILFSVRAPVGRINVSREKIILGRGLASINHKQGFNSFVLYQLMNIFYRDNLIGEGTIYSSVTKKNVEDIRLVVPDESITEKFNAMAEKIDKAIFTLTKKKKLLEESRELLIPRLMSGMIEIDEIKYNYPKETLA